MTTCRGEVRQSDLRERAARSWANRPSEPSTGSATAGEGSWVPYAGQTPQGTIPAAVGSTEARCRPASTARDHPRIGARALPSAVSGRLGIIPTCAGSASGGPTPRPRPWGNPASRVARPSRREPLASGGTIPRARGAPRLERRVAVGRGTIPRARGRAGFQPTGAPGGRGDSRTGVSNTGDGTGLIEASRSSQAFRLPRHLHRSPVMPLRRAHGRAGYVLGAPLRSSTACWTVPRPGP